MATYGSVEVVTTRTRCANRRAARWTLSCAHGRSEFESWAGWSITEEMDVVSDLLWDHQWTQRCRCAAAALLLPPLPPTYRQARAWQRLSPPPWLPPALPPARARGCDRSYPTVCIPSAPPDLDLADIPYRRFPVLPPDPHRLDGDRDGIGGER